MATSNILPFAQDAGANVMSDGAYSADSQRLIGNQPGIARAQLANKAWRQVSAMAAGFGLFIANRQASNVTDSLTAAQVETALQNALASHSSLPGTIGNITTTWWRKSSDGYIEQGIAGIPVAAMGGFTDVIFPIAFATTLLDVQCSVYNAAQEQVGWSLPSLTGIRIQSGNSDAAPRIVNILLRGY